MPRHGLRRFFRHGMFPQLMVFEAVARLGSVTRAAQELHLAQSTVSTQLKKLAQSLDIALFDQQGRGLVLTYAGRELQHVCIELVGLFERAEARLTALRSPRPEVLRMRGGALHVGCATGCGVLFALPRGPGKSARRRSLAIGRANGGEPGRRLPEGTLATLPAIRPVGSGAWRMRAGRELA